MGIIFHRMILTNHHDHHEYHSAQLSPLNIDHIIQDQISKIFKNNVFSSLINIFRVIRNTQTIQAKTHSESRAMLKFCSSMGIVVFFCCSPSKAQRSWEAETTDTGSASDDSGAKKNDDNWVLQGPKEENNEKKKWPHIF